MSTYNSESLTPIPTPLQTIARYLTTNVLPVLKDRHDEFLLHELVKRGENHKVRLLLLFIVSILVLEDGAHCTCCSEIKLEAR